MPGTSKKGPYRGARNIRGWPLCGSFFAAVDVGITQRGYEIQQDGKAEVIDESDAYGQSTIDLVYRGGDVRIMFESRAYKAGSITPFWPWSTFGFMGIIARLASDIAAAFNLTVTPGTPAFTNGPRSVTAPKTILSPNVSQRMLFDSRLRNVPNQLTCLPIDISGAIGWFTQT